ncbi:MAG: SDR family NAD(P)-dependent oxidoreductase, partial [Armatimonadetes bacterium]|nr:SDR family NAD(P)-dependent oxidoreductase [Armatimonadota bacterium]
MPAPNPQPTALITGASAGIGLALAAGLVEDGYRVAILGRDAARLEAAAAHLESAAVRLAAAAGPAARSDAAANRGATVLALPADLRDPAAVDAAIARIDTDFGRL